MDKTFLHLYLPVLRMTGTSYNVQVAVNGGIKYWPQILTVLISKYKFFLLTTRGFYRKLGINL